VVCGICILTAAVSFLFNRNYFVIPFYLSFRKKREKDWQRAEVDIIIDKNKREENDD